MSAKVAEIVAQQSFLSQTSDLSATNLVTPSTAGQFRASFYTETTGSLHVTIGFTDDSGTQSWSASNLSNATNNSVGCMSFYALTSAPITVAATSNPTGRSFNLYVTIEAL